jgi:phage repressor protein C with HTH and peptisase S24 domain/DNA-binding Xre family transcriptional regulator
MSLKENLIRLRTTHGWSQQELANRVGVRQNTIAAIETGATTRTRYLPELARAFGVTVDELDPPEGRSGAALAPPVFTGPRTFPVFSSAEGGPGEVIRSVEPVDWVPRPAPVAHINDAYCMLVSGDSMFPEFRPGDSAIVNPRLPIVGNEVYVFYREIEGEGRATIKQLRRASPETWFLSQHNPPSGQKQDFTLPRRDWRWAHRVVGKYSRV